MKLTEKEWFAATPFPQPGIFVHIHNCLQSFYSKLELKKWAPLDKLRGLFQKENAQKENSFLEEILLKISEEPN